VPGEVVVKIAHVEDRWHSHGADGEMTPTARYGKGRRWRVRYIDPDGCERNRSFDPKIDADRFRATTEADLARGAWIDPDASKTRLADYARDWLAGRSGEPATLDILRVRVKGHIIPALGDLRLGDIRPSRVQSFMSGLRTLDGRNTPLAASTARGVFTTLSAILSAAVDDEMIRSNPARKDSVKRPVLVQRKVVPWPGSRVKAVRAHLPERWQVFCDVGAGCGLRQGEILGLDVGLIDMLRHVVHVRQQLRIVSGRLVLAPPKHGIERDVPLGEPTALAIAAHLARFPAVELTLPWRVPDGKPRQVRLLLATAAGFAVRRDSFNHVWRQAIRASGLQVSDETGTHQLRHRYASMMLAGGVDIRALAQYMGHSDPAITLRTYIHLTGTAPDRARKAIETALAAEEDDEATPPASETGDGTS
jgi:integrase